MSLSELKPCPFCGCPDLHPFEHCDGEESYGFQCTRCWMTGPQFGSANEAAAAWNARAILEAEGAQTRTDVETMDVLGGHGDIYGEPLDVLNGKGWVYFGPDVGIEYAPEHPIESGEMPDATDVRRSTYFEDWLVGENHKLDDRVRALAVNHSPRTDVEPGLTPDEQKAQAARCGCKGGDDYCPCQNVADSLTKAQRSTVRAGYRYSEAVKAARTSPTDAPGMSREAVAILTSEQIARAIAESYGVDPDDDAPLSVMCTAENGPVAWWEVYREQADAIRALASLGGREDA